MKNLLSLPSLRQFRWLAFFWLAAMGAGVPLLPASDEIPAALPAHPVLLRGGDLYPVSGPPIPGGELLIGTDGSIAAVGLHLADLPADTEIRPLAPGQRVYPGLIGAYSALGLTEIQAVKSTIDLAELGDVNPNARAQSSINPDSELLPVARSNGVLSVLSVPQNTAGLIAGQSALIRLDGWTWEQMTIKAPVALHLYWPTMRIVREPNYPLTPEQQQKDMEAALEKIAESFRQARAYSLVADPADTDLRWEAMRPVFTGKLPVFVHAHELRQIESVLRWAAGEPGLKIVLVGGMDAWRVADLLKARDIPVIFSAIQRLPDRRGDDYDVNFATPGKLLRAGVKFCISGEGDLDQGMEASMERNLPYKAAQAVPFGLPPDQALRAITLSPAEILGVADRLGSLETGKEATLIVTDGDPLDIRTNVQSAWIAGRPVDLTSRQSRLRDKYAEKLRRTP